MSHLYVNLNLSSNYVDKTSGVSYQLWQRKLKKSSTVYVGNLSFYTTEDQIYELFSKCGVIDKVVMGLNRKTKNPCGFAFVKFFSQCAGRRATEFLNQSILDGRQIRVDWDSGENIEDECRKYGRGVHGMQWRDEFRTEEDIDRGGKGVGLDYVPPLVSRKNRKRVIRNDAFWDKYGRTIKRKDLNPI